MARILVLGATGGCGVHVVRLAVAAGHAVTAVVRPSVAYDPPAGATVIRDELLRDGAIADAMRGREVVISCVGIRRRWPRNPWSRLLSPPDLVARTARAIVDGAGPAGVRRVLAISAAGVADSAPRMSWPMRWVVGHSQIGVAYRDLAVAEAILAASALDWTAVRPVTLTSGRARAVREVERYWLTATVARESVARWLVDHVDLPGPATPMVAQA